MRKGKPSIRYADRGLHFESPGTPTNPVLAHIYDEKDNVVATLTEERGACIDEGYVDFFLGPNCRPAVHRHHLVEILPDGTKKVLHNDPKSLGRSREEWFKFLEGWMERHGR